MEAQIDTAAAPQMNRRQKAKATTREKILEAGKRLFEMPGGYLQATTRSVADEAGMSTGAIYASFDNKAALYFAIYGHRPISTEVGREMLIAASHVLAELRADPAWGAPAEGDPSVRRLVSVLAEATKAPE